jgi:hypothetical protein
MSNLLIRTSYDRPPVPTKEYDWSAVSDNYEGGDKIGRGSTEALAVTDLLRELGCKDKGGEVGACGECLLCTAEAGVACRAKVLTEAASK